MRESDFEWDESKNSAHLKKHGVSFRNAQFAFLDRRRVIAKDHTHSKKEQRYYCFESDRERHWYIDSSIYLPKSTNSHNWCRLLA